MQNKVVIITGASSGIGKALVYEFAKRGAKIAMGARNLDELHKIETDLKSRGVDALSVQTDVTRETDCKNLIEKTVERFGKIDILVNNAGISEQKLLTDITDSDWENMISTNLSGAFYFCRAVLPYFVHRKSGRIINISSMWGETGGSCEVHYSAAKAGLIGLTKALAKEVAPSGITVNAVSPGVINTEMVTKLGKDTVDMLREEIPVMRLGTPEDVANAVSFLADDRASYITGQIISVNGGIVI